jgi:DNA-binding transcriptional LysR family regulator
MNILHLRYAVEVEKTGSITQAADNLYMGQPNLSKAIKELETTLNLIIFKRTSKGVVPTKKGKEFLGYAKNLLSQIDEMEALYKPQKANEQRFSISIPRASYITHAFTQFVKMLDHEREIEVNFKETNTGRTIDNIIEGESNLGIIRYQTIFEKYFLDLLQEKGLRYEAIWEFEHLAVMSNQHPLANCHEVDYSQLQAYIEIIHGDLTIPSLPFSKLKKLQQAEYLKKHIYVYERGSQFDLLSNVPLTYMWGSPIPAELLKRFGLVQRRCKAPDRKYKDVLIYPNGYRLNKLEKQFLVKLKEVCDELVQKNFN